MKKDSKNALLYLIYTELKKLNDKKIININQSNETEETKKEIGAEAKLELLKQVLIERS